jgi:hypothetical protein
MDKTQIDHIYADIRQEIRTAQFEDALQKMDAFVAKLGEQDLDHQMLSLAAQYNSFKKDMRTLGQQAEEKRNRLIFAMIELLTESKDRAYNHFVLQNETVADLEKDRERELLSKIESLENKIEKMVASKLEDIIIPPNYQAEISKEFRIAFCYPENWTFNKFPREVMYGGAVDQNSAAQYGFARNFNLVISDISTIDQNDQEIFDANPHQVVALLPQCQLIDQRNFLLQGLPARKYLFQYISNEGIPLGLYQVAAIFRDQQKMYTWSFTAHLDHMDESMVLFDNILATFKF